VNHLAAAQQVQRACGPCASHGPDVVVRAGPVRSPVRQERREARSTRVPGRCGRCDALEVGVASPHWPFRLSHPPDPHLQFVSAAPGTTSTQARPYRMGNLDEGNFSRPVILAGPKEGWPRLEPRVGRRERPGRVAVANGGGRSRRASQGSGRRSRRLPPAQLGSGAPVRPARAGSRLRRRSSRRSSRSQAPACRRR